MGGKKLLLFFIFQVVIGYSQTTAKDSIKLEEVIVSITKIRDSIKNTPYSISANDYSNFQNNINIKHNLDDLLEKGSIKVNYFTDSLSIKGFFIPKDDLENIITIKKGDLLKIVLPNEVVYLSISDISSIQPQEIKQNIINQLYSDIIKQIKADLKIEVNNQQLLQL